MTLKALRRFTASCMAAAMALLSAYTAAAASSAKFKLSSNKTEVFKDNSFTVTLSAENSFSAAGIYAEISFDKIAFELQKYTVVNDNISDCSVGYRNSKVLFVWDSDKNASFSGNLLKLQFKTVSDSSEGKKKFSFDVIEMCDEKFKSVSNAVTPAEVSVKKLTASDNVLKTIDLINNIGTVDASDACLKRITLALNAFSKLTSSEKGLVSNYPTLAEAQKKYNELKEKEEAEKNQQALQNEINKFLSDNADALALTESNAKISDLTRVTDALNEYATKSAYVREKLKNEYEHLKKLRDKINALIEDENAKNAAAEIAAGFRETFKDLIELPVSNVVYEPEVLTEIESAINTYDEVFDDYTKALLTKEYQHIKALYERYKELEIKNAPEPESVVREYTAFREKYLKLIMMSEDSVTQNEYSLIQQAMSDYDSMSDMAKGKMASVYRHLMNLLFALNNAEVDYIDSDDTQTDIDSDTNGNEIIKDVVKYKTKTLEAGEIGLKTSYKVSDTVWMLLVLLGVSIILFSVPTTLYFVMKNKYLKGGENGE